MKKSFKFRIYFNKSQAIACDEILNSCLILYNNALTQRIDSYKLNKTSIYYSQQCKNINFLNTNKLENVHSQVYQSTLKTVQKAYDNFFTRVKKKSGKAGFPRFKTKLKSFTFPQCNLKRGGVKLLPNNKLDITGIPGEVKMVLHRPILGTIKTVQIIKSSTNKYYIVISCDNISILYPPKTDKSVGLDMGIKYFATTDDGTTFHHPKPYKTSKQKLSYLNKKLAAAQLESKNKEKLRIKRAKIYEKEVNVRGDFQHKLSHQIVEQFDEIFIEKLNIKSMLRSKKTKTRTNLNKMIANASWNAFAQKLIYKAVSADKIVIQVNPRNTSKMCFDCGEIKEKLSLRNRLFHCHDCGMVMGRDMNAAKNIRRLGASLIE